MSNTRTTDNEKTHLLSPDLERVLVVIEDYHMGDFVIALPVLEAFGRYFTHKVDILMVSAFIPLFRRLPSADKFRIIAYDDVKKRRTLGQGFRFFGLLSRLFMRYQATIALTGKVKTATLVAVSGARQRIGHVHSRRGWLYTRLVESPPGAVHRVDEYAALLQCIGFSGRPRPLRLLPAEEDSRYVRDLLREAGVPAGGRVAVIHAGAGHDFRCWPPERFAAVADHLVRRWDMHVCLVGAPGEEAALDHLRGMTAEPGRAFPFVESLTRLLALFDAAHILVANDSGPAHLAATTALPMVIVFGPTSADVWGPFRETDVTIFQGTLCEPRSCRTCEFDSKCLLEVQVPGVIEAIDRYMTR